ncbi:hypothetical protein [Actinoallomurus sp. CA-142502]|uniref:hypothetical protein n=1 Tax=Actinoallomurus sp. CA-142502 TaxID=3239885 RepID=UPI003D8F3A07
MTRSRAGRTAAVCALAVLLAGCADHRTPREQVRAACEKYVAAKAKADHLAGRPRFVAESVEIGAVRTRASVDGTVQLGQQRHDFLCSVEKKGGHWRQVVVIWRDFTGL